MYTHMQLRLEIHEHLRVDRVFIPDALVPWFTFDTLGMKAGFFKKRKKKKVGCYRVECMGQILIPGICQHMSLILVTYNVYLKGCMCCGEGRLAYGKDRFNFPVSSLAAVFGLRIEITVSLSWTLKISPHWSRSCAKVATSLHYTWRQWNHQPRMRLQKLVRVEYLSRRWRKPTH